MRIATRFFVVVYCLFGGTFSFRTNRFGRGERSHASLIEVQDWGSVPSMVPGLLVEADDTFGRDEASVRFKRNKPAKGGKEVVIDCINIVANTPLKQIVNCDGQFLSSEKAEFSISLSAISQHDINKLFCDKVMKLNFSLIHSQVESFSLSMQPERHNLKAVIWNNDLLSELGFGLSKVNKKLSLDIRGNRKLSRESLINITSFSDSSDKIEVIYIQEYGECIVPSILKSFIDLEGCVYTTTGIIINENTETLTAFPSNLAEIRGCLKILNTKLTSIDFAKGIYVTNCDSQNTITGNSQLCLHPKEMVDLEDRLGKTVFEKNQDCAAECKASWFLEKKKSGCVIIKGDLTLTNINQDENFTSFKFIEVIQGRLTITSTDLKRIDFFPNLKNITPADQSSAAIHIQYNSKLTEISLPAIEKIEVAENQKYIYVAENGDYDMPQDERDFWEAKFPGSSSSIKSPYRKTDDVNETKNNKRGKKSKGKSSRKSVGSDDEGLTGKEIAGIVVGIIVPVVVIAVLAVSGVFIYFRFIKKKETEYIGVFYPTIPGSTEKFMYIADNDLMQKVSDLFKNNRENIKKDREERVTMTNQGDEKEEKQVLEIKNSNDKKSELEEQNDARKVEELIKKDKTKIKSVFKPKDKKIAQHPPKGNAVQRTAAGAVSYDEYQIDAHRLITGSNFEDERIENHLMIRERLRGPIITKGYKETLEKRVKAMEEEYANVKEEEFTCDPGKCFARLVTWKENKLEMQMDIETYEFQEPFLEQLKRREIKVFETINVGDLTLPTIFRKADTRRKRTRKAIIDHLNMDAVEPFVSRKESEHWKVHPVEECDCDLSLGIDGPDPNTRIYGMRCEEAFNKDKAKFQTKKEKQVLVNTWKHKVKTPVVWEQSFPYTALHMTSFAQDMIDYYLSTSSAIKFEIISFFKIRLVFLKRKCAASQDTLPVPVCTVYEFVQPKDDTLIFNTDVVLPVDTLEIHDNSLIKSYLNASMQVPIGKSIQIAADHFIRICELALMTCGKMAVEILDPPVRIFGEVRGKSADLLKMFSVPEGENEFAYLFLGNYLGHWNTNITTLVFLFTLKLYLGKRCVLLRGMTEWMEVNKELTFAAEIKEMFPGREKEVLDKIHKVFANLPLACRVGSRIFCTSAGIAPEMEQLKHVKLPIEDLVPDTLPFNMMFATPNYTVSGFFDNIELGSGYFFGEKELVKAAEALKFDIMITSKVLPSGFGRFGRENYIYSLCTAMNAQENCETPVAALMDIDINSCMHVCVVTQSKPDPLVLQPNNDAMTKSVATSVATTKQSLKSESKSGTKSAVKPVSDVRQPESKDNKSKKSDVQSKSKNGPPTAPAPQSKSGPSQSATTSQIKPN